VDLYTYVNLVFAECGLFIDSFQNNQTYTKLSKCAIQTPPRLARVWL